MSENDYKFMKYCLLHAGMTLKLRKYYEDRCREFEASNDK